MDGRGLTWDSWKPQVPTPSSSGGISIQVQGAPLGDILYVIRSELEKVRQSQDLAPILAEVKASIEAEKNARNVASQAMKEYVDMKLANIDYNERLLQMDAKMDDMETKLRDAVVLDAVRAKEIRILNDRIHELERKLASFEALDGRVSDLQGGMEASLHAVRSQCQELAENNLDAVARLRQVEDSTFALASQQGKTLGEVSKLSTSLDATNRNLDNLENLVDRHTEDIKSLLQHRKNTIPEGYLFPMTQSPSFSSPPRPLASLIAPIPVPASSTDSSTPRAATAPKTAAASSQDVIVRELVIPPNVALREDLEKMYNLVDELEHQLKLLSVACTEGLAGVSKKTDKKIEFMTNWIVKYVKGVKEGVPRDSLETDIGKIQLGVKCLVCNQPAKQNEVDTSSNHPSFKNTFALRREGGKHKSHTNHGSSPTGAGGGGGGRTRSRSPTDGFSGGGVGSGVLLPRVTSSNSPLPSYDGEPFQSIKTSQDSPVDIRTTDSDKGFERYFTDRLGLIFIYNAITQPCNILILVSISMLSCRNNVARPVSAQYRRK
jgi:hypothetical protein